jgi:hypothetical protein
MTIRKIQADDFEAYVMAYSPGFTQNAPWGRQPFDCFVLDCGQCLGMRKARELARELALAENDWIETFGPGAEELHDVIDAVSVELGRQPAVGEGSPMTAWHEDVASKDSFADYVALGGLGSQSVKVILVIGSDPEADDIKDALETRLLDRT